MKTDQDNWRGRWLYADRDAFLHRVAEMTWNNFPDPSDPIHAFEPNGPNDEDMFEAIGETLCGLTGRLVMPGIFARLGAYRCPVCCQKVGIPEGSGNPFNKGILEPCDVKRSPEKETQ